MLSLAACKDTVSFMSLCRVKADYPCLLARFSI